MPRDGSGIYSTPPGTDGGPPGVTIASTPYNVNVHDVEADLNAARPIIAGGTGATSAAGALFNLSGETATQIVTSYDSHLWKPGSFRSDAAAPGAPNSTSKFAGVCYIGEALANPPTNQNVVVEAREMDSPVKPGLLYTRQKTAGVWSAWNYAGTGDDQTAARSAIYAAPFDAMAYNGMQVNGLMEVSQEKGATVTSTNDNYILDGWKLLNVGSTAVLNAAQTAAGGLGQYSANHLLNIVVATAQPSLSAGTVCGLRHIIEGYRMVRLSWGYSGAKPITVSFWTAHTRTGTYSASIKNAASTRSCVAAYTQDVSGTWEYKTVTFPGCTDGVWEPTNLQGLFLQFAQAAGTTFTAPSAGVWHNANYLAAPGQVNGVAATSDVFRITGVVVLPGTQAPAAAQSPLIMRPFDQELVTCLRYWESSYQYGTSVGTATIIDQIVWMQNQVGGYNNPGNRMFKVQKRALPTMSVYSPATGAAGTIRNTFSSTEIAGSSILEIGTKGWSGVNGSRTDGQSYSLHYTADARL